MAENIHPCWAVPSRMAAAVAVSAQEYLSVTDEQSRPLTDVIEVAAHTFTLAECWRTKPYAFCD